MCVSISFGCFGCLITLLDKDDFGKVTIMKDGLETWYIL